MIDKKIDKKKALSLCICRGCPSFVKCSEEIAYCVNEKSKCIKNKKGCICPGCRVQIENGFKRVFYCIDGKVE